MAIPLQPGGGASGTGAGSAAGGVASGCGGGRSAAGGGTAAGGKAAGGGATGARGGAASSAAVGGATLSAPIEARTIQPGCGGGSPRGSASTKFMPAIIRPNTVYLPSIERRGTNIR